MCLYKQAFSRIGWNTYDTISVQFDNQIVCTRRDKKPNNIIPERITSKYYRNHMEAEKYIVALELGSSKITGLAGYKNEEGQLIVSAIEKKTSPNTSKEDV